MIGTIKVSDREILSGFHWESIESDDDLRGEISEIISKRRENIREGADLPALSTIYTFSKTGVGAYSAGVLPLGYSPSPGKKALSLAALCAKYAQEHRTADAVFAWPSGDNGETVMLVAIKNGLPFFDETVVRDEFDGEFKILLSLFDSGCSTFGDEKLLSNINGLNIEKLLENEALVEKICNSGISKAGWVFIGVSLALVVLAGAYAWHNNNAAKKEAEEAALAAQRSMSPAAQFGDAQKALLSAIPGCMKIDDVALRLLSLHFEIKNFFITTGEASCIDGLISVQYKSDQASPDLTVRSVEPRMILSERLSLASISESVKIAPAMINIADLTQLQSWLVGNGIKKQRMQKIGIEAVFNPPSPVYTAVAPPRGVPVAVKGMIAVSGQAKYITDAARQFNHVVWKKITIVRQPNGLMFNLSGEYYAIKD